VAELIPIVAILSVFGTGSWIAYVVFELVRTRFRVRAATELQAKFIDRLGAQDVGVFLSSEHGGRLLRAFSDQPVGDGAHMRILRALQSGIVLLSVGVGLFAYMSLRTLSLEGEDAIALVATLATALGIGLLAATAASYRMSTRLGLLPRRDDTGQAHAS
jgi:hypothetical protein